LLGAKTANGDIQCLFFVVVCLFSGKILNDDQPVSDYKIDQKSFVVVMVSKVQVTLNKIVCFANEQNATYIY